MAKPKPRLTPDQRNQLEKAGVDPDRWLKSNVRASLVGATESQGSVDQEVASSLAKTLKDVGKGADQKTIYPNPKVGVGAGPIPGAASKNPGDPNLGPGVALFEADGSVKKGKAPKDGIWTFKQWANEGGGPKLVDTGRGRLVKDKDGVERPAPTEVVGNDGKFVPAQQNPVTGQFGPAPGQTTAPSVSNTSSGPRPGFAPVAAGAGMDAATETRLRAQIAATNPNLSQAQIDDQINIAKSASGDQGYAEFQADSPGNTPILKRGGSFALPNMGPNGPLAVGGSSSISVPTMTTVDEQLKSMYQLPPDQLKKLQTDLFNGGYYGSGDISQIPFGNPDQATLMAYHNLLSDVAQRNRAGLQVTLEDVLESSAAVGAAKVAKAKPKYQPIDPRDAATAINQVAQQVLGRKATVEEQRLMLAGWNHSGELAFNAAQNPGQVAPQQVSGPALAEDLLLQKNPQEAFGYGLTSAMGTLMNLAAPAVNVGGGLG